MTISFSLTSLKPLYKNLQKQTKPKPKDLNAKAT